MAKHWKINYSSTSRSDLRKIKNYLSNELQAPRAADLLVLKIIDGIDKLSEFPERFPVYHDEPWHSLEIRYFPVKKYFIFYKLDQTIHEIGIIRIMHTSRDYSKHLPTN